MMLFVPAVNVISRAAVTYAAGPGNVVAGAMGWWGLRAYSVAAVGSNAVRLRRDSDNVEANFVTLGNGSVDVASITTFKGAANLFIVTLYDQTGGGNDLVQATAANQPQFILSGIGALPIVRFVAASSLYLQSTASFTQAQPFTFSWTFKRTGNFAAYNTVMGDAGNFLSCGAHNSANNAYMYAGSVPTTSMSDNVMHAVQAVFNGGSSDLNVDGVVATVSPGSTGLTAQAVAYGRGSVNPAEGDSMEAGLWPFAFTSTQSTNMRANQHIYWGF